MPSPTSFLAALDLERLSPSRLWSRLDPESRALAARSFFTQAGAEAASLRSIDVTLARLLRSREVTVRKMAVDKKAQYLARLVAPDDALAAGLLHALHLEARRPMLVAYLDALGIAHENGLITGDDTKPPEEAALAAAVAKLLAGFPPAEVEVYLASLLAVEPGLWAGLKPLLAARR